MWSVMEFYQFCPQILLNLYFYGQHYETEQESRKSTFSDVFRKMQQIQNLGEKWS